MVAINHTVWFLKFVYRFNMVVFRQKISKRTCFCFRTWFVIFWSLCFLNFVFQFKFVGFSLQDGCFLTAKISDKSMFLFSNMVCFVLIIVFWVQVFWFITWKWLFLNKKSDKSIFLFSNMVCFVLIIVFWILFFNSSLLVSPFKMVVFKQQKYQTRACFCFRTWFVLFWLLCFEFKFVGFSPAKGCF